LDLLEQRIALLGSLADALVSAGASISAFDIDGLEARIITQQQLCAKSARSIRESMRCSATVPSRLRHRVQTKSALRQTPENSPMRQTLKRLQAIQSSVSN